MRTSSKIAIWSFILSIVVLFVWGGHVPNPEDRLLTRQGWIEFEREWRPWAQFYQGLVSLCWLISVCAVIYRLYKNLTEVRTPVVTNVQGDNIVAQNSTVATHGANIDQSTTISDRSIGSNDDLMAALNEIHNAILRSNASEEKKRHSDLLASKIESELSSPEPEGNIGSYASDLIKIAKDLGPAAKGISDAIIVLSKIF